MLKLSTVQLVTYLYAAHFIDLTQTIQIVQLPIRVLQETHAKT